MNAIVVGKVGEIFRCRYRLIKRAMSLAYLNNSPDELPCTSLMYVENKAETAALGRTPDLFSKDFLSQSCALSEVI